MKQFYKILAVLMAMFLLLSLTVLPAFADDDETGETNEVGETNETGENGDAENGNTEPPIAGEGEATGEDNEASTETTGDAEASTETATGETATAESKGLSTNAIVWIVVGGVVVVAAAVLGIIFREKVGKFFRVYKSEIKKIVWLPWNQTCKSTLVVLVILVICAAAICLLDLGLSKGFLAFLDLFKK